MNFDVFLNYFESLQSGGTIILLFSLLLVCLIIGWFYGRKISSLESYLYSPGEMKAYEFGLSETAYMIAVGTTFVFLSSLTVKYGSFFLLVVVVAWFISLYAYERLVYRGDLIDFFRKKGAHLGEYIICGKKEDSRTRQERMLVCLISLIIGLTFFGYYFLEIFALKVLIQGFSPSTNSTMILGSAVVLTIIYTTLGGYKGTFKTDVIQTLFLVLALAFVIIFGVNKVWQAGNFTLAPFIKTGIGHSILILFSYIAIGIASLVTGLDIWARMRASEGEDKKEGKKGLKWSLITVIPFLFVCGFGILFVSLGFVNNLSEQAVLHTIIPNVTKEIGIPFGFLMALLIIVAISTADTSLITLSQAIEPIFKKKFRTLTFFRFLAIIVGFLGLISALLVPVRKTFQMIFITISFPVSLTPIVIIRSAKKSIHPGVSIVSIILSSIIGLVVGISFPEYASYCAIVILISALIIYGSGIAFVKFKNKESGK